MKAADAQLLKQDNCTKREEFNSLRSVIPSVRIERETQNQQKHSPNMGTAGRGHLGGPLAPSWQL